MWNLIETAPKVDGQFLLGFDAETAKAHGRHEAGLCVIEWLDADDDEDWEAGWQVYPFAEGLDCIVSETALTHWMYLPSPPERS